MNNLDSMKRRLDKRRGKPMRKKVKRLSPPPPIPKPLPPPQPEQKTFRAVEDLPESFRLIGGQQLDVGDVFWHIKKLVIKKITKTAGSNTVAVEAECTKRHWSQNNPNI